MTQFKDLPLGTGFYMSGNPSPFIKGTNKPANSGLPYDSSWLSEHRVSCCQFFSATPVTISDINQQIKPENLGEAIGVVPITEITGTFEPIYTGPPEQILALTASSVDAETILLTWVNPYSRPPITHYSVTGSGFDTILTGYTTSGSINLRTGNPTLGGSLSMPPSGNCYTFQISACNNDGCGILSSPSNSVFIDICNLNAQIADLNAEIADLNAEMANKADIGHSH